MKAINIPTYEDYREDVAPWLGTVPTAWKFERGKWHHRYRKKLNAKRESDNVLSLTLRGVVNNDPENPEGLVPSDYATYQLFDNGDLVFKLIDLENVRTSRVGLVHENGIMSSAYVRIVPSSETNPRFLYYYFYNLYLGEVYNRLGSGVRSTLNQQDLLDLPVPVIPLATQDAIASFLDHKTNKVDQAISIKEQQIALLKERKQIVIQDAVSKGINAKAPIKDSGIDWIGKIPAHWEVKRAKFIFREVNERSLDGTEELLSVSHTTGVTSRSEKNINMFMAEDYTGSKLCRPGDVVINTMWAWMGALGVSSVSGIVSPSYGVYRQLKADSFNNRYLEWLLRGMSYVEHYNRVSTGLHSSRLRFYAHMFLDMFLGFPPRAEQDEIVAFVETEAEKIDAGIAIKENQITALREYKTSLINEAVTGKIKVV